MLRGKSGSRRGPGAQGGERIPEKKDQCVQKLRGMLQREWPWPRLWAGEGDGVMRGTEFTTGFKPR